MENIKCPKCQKENPSSSKFCNSCGSPLNLCSKCENHLSNGDLFCPNCGQKSDKEIMLESELEITLPSDTPKYTSEKATNDATTTQPQTDTQQPKDLFSVVREIKTNERGFRIFEIIRKISFNLWWVVTLITTVITPFASIYRFKDSSLSNLYIINSYAVPCILIVFALAVMFHALPFMIIQRIVLLISVKKRGYDIVKTIPLLEKKAEKRTLEENSYCDDVWEILYFSHFPMASVVFAIKKLFTKFFTVSLLVYLSIVHPIILKFNHLFNYSTYAEGNWAVVILLVSYFVILLFVNGIFEKIKPKLLKKLKQKYESK